MTHAVATLAGGCFWCLEAGFQMLKGVVSVKSGYMGSDFPNPTYEAVCSGDTGHAEVVQITFDPEVISYADVLAVFFTVHDPTTLNRQGNDVGTQYRSAIFWQDEAQRDTAKQVMAALEQARAFDAPIVTEVVQAGTFWPAEAYHDDYFRRHPNQSYCVFVVGPKVAKIRNAFADRLKQGA